jgi:hypothetical protein
MWRGELFHLVTEKPKTGESRRTLLKPHFMKAGKPVPVTVRVQTGNAEALKDIHLYVFDKEGQLLESTPLRNGEATLKTAARNIEGQTQMIIGPEIPKQFQDRKLNPVMMLKMGGFQPSVRLDMNNQILISGLPKLVFPHWNWCLITGNISKTFSIDGQNKTLAVCDARVHICEVDRIRFWWPKIPVNIIDELSRKLREIILRPKPVFPPKPGPDPDPIRKLINNRNFKTDIQPLSSFGIIGPERQLQSFRMSAGNEMTEMKMSAGAEANLPQLSHSIQNGLLSSSQITVRDTILNNFHLLHPYICLWPQFWPYFYYCDEIATVYTDCNGKFNFEYFNFNNDKDIYVWVEVCINGQWVTVYRPSLPCHTKWNYACGSDINITITDPRVMPCTCGQQLQGEIVWFRSIGESATALHIEQGDANTVSIQGSSISNVGCTDIINGVRISPFGESLYFKLLFGDGFPKPGVTHYRWRKTRIKDAALNNIFFPQTTVVNGMVQKTYFVITTDAQNHMHFETKAVTLGAEGSGENIGYRIPHWDIYQDPGVPAADKLKTIQWTSPDFWSAGIDSTGLSDGTWRFDLELLNESGGSFSVVQVPKQVFQVSDYNNSGNSVDAPDTYLRINSGSPANAFNLKVKVRVDNATCVADIQDANITVNGNVEYSGRCGFLHYTDVNQPVHISFIATHPRNFARFSFGVIKGNNTENPGASQEGYVLSSVGLYALSGGIFAHDFPASQLLGTCPQAAFAENLYLTALATNGSRRLQEYDASDTNAFALSNT